MVASHVLQQPVHVLPWLQHHAVEGAVLILIFDATARCVLFAAT
jgi:hypothetical protein